MDCMTATCIFIVFLLIVRNNLELYFVYIFSLFFTVRLHFIIRTLHQTHILDIIELTTIYFNLNVYITYISPFIIVVYVCLTYYKVVMLIICLKCTVS